MFTAIYTFVATLVGSIFWLVVKILGVALSLPLWFIVATNAIGTCGIVAITYLITQSIKRNNTKKS